MRGGDEGRGYGEEMREGIEEEWRNGLLDLSLSL